MLPFIPARRVEIARRVLRARFVTGTDMRYGLLVERENVQLLATNTVLKEKVGIVLIRVTCYF